MLYLYLIFPSFALYRGTVYPLFTVHSLLIGVLDKFGAVLYFQEQEKSIGPSGLDVSQGVRLKAAGKKTGGPRSFGDNAHHTPE